MEAESSRNAVSARISPRAYQLELLEESLHGNIIIALETGSGKTHIAILRMKAEVEREPTKVSWFLTPTVMLCDQQRHAIATCLPVPVAQVNGQLQPDQWKDRKMWRSVVESHRIVVSTPQVLLDALRHGYISLGLDISLVVFDEAHHAVDDHPYNRIMIEFYHSLLSDNFHSQAPKRPSILGLTASPITGGTNIYKSFMKIQDNLDSIVRTSHSNQEELSKFVHIPIYKEIYYLPSDSGFSTNLGSLSWVASQLNIEEDPYVVNLRSRLANPRLDAAKQRKVNQQLSKALYKKDTYTHRGIRDFLAAAENVNADIGSWAADWYIYNVIEKARESVKPFDNDIAQTTDSQEKMYLVQMLERVQATPVSEVAEDVQEGCSGKVEQLVDHLLEEKGTCMSLGEPYIGLVFVQRRDAVVALSEVLKRHPLTKDIFSIGSLLGTSDSVYRRSFLDLSRGLLKLSQNETLDSFRISAIDLIVSTSVAEEGIDIQACCHVVRWDPPPNMASWLQSRGRARRQRSTYAMLHSAENEGKTLSQWQAEETQMRQFYNSSRSPSEAPSSVDEREVDDVTFVIESTGATLTLPSAISHIEHFCASIPSSTYSKYQPTYEMDPPDLPDDWHLTQHPLPPYTGPYGAKLTLPRALPVHLREFSVKQVYANKASACRHAAFEAYRALYGASLLNDHLLPITSLLEPPPDKEVKALLEDVEKRASTASVSVQMDPWIPEQITDKWWMSELEIGGETACLLTKTRPTEWDWDHPVLLHRPRAEPTSLMLRVLTSEAIYIEEDELAEAKAYTRRLFWCLYENRMDWTRTDFAYLVLPRNHHADMLSWFEPAELDTKEVSSTDVVIGAETLGEQYEYPDDIALVKAGSKRFRFIRWHFDRLSKEDEDLLRESKFIPDGELTYPLLVVEALPRRTNFLLPLPPASDSIDASSSTEADPGRKLEYMHPCFANVPTVSLGDLEHALLLPSILRAMTLSVTVDSFRTTILQSPSAHPSLSTIPSELLMTALTAPVASERTNYQRLETLGDTVLKLLVGVQLLAEHPFWHEGYLSKRKDHAVNNARLAKDALRLELHRWIIRDVYAGKRWTPKMLPAPPIVQPGVQAEVGAPSGNAATAPASKQKKQKKTQQLSMKVIADVVESVIGAAYLTGGLDMGLSCARVFDLGMHWEDLPARFEQLISQVPVPEPGDVVPKSLEHVEAMLGYTFERKIILQEALTHSSHHGHYHTDTMSYERLEYLGDAVLDMVATDYLYHAQPKNGKPYSPGHIHLRKAALVNSHFLAYICLRQSKTVKGQMPRLVRPDPQNPEIVLEEETQEVWLHQCLLHASHHILDAQRDVRARYRLHHEAIDRVLFSEEADTEGSGSSTRSAIFPWTDLTRLQAPKIFSDMIESLIGAVYLDTKGDMDTVRAVLENLGWLDVMTRIVERSIDVQHPVSRLHLWASMRGKKVGYEFKEDNGNITCGISIDGELRASASQTSRGHGSKGEVKFRAAQEFNMQYTIEDTGLEQMPRSRDRPQNSDRKHKGKGKAS